MPETVDVNPMPSKRKAANTDQPRDSPTPQKRQRVSRACDQCRAAREKCDGVQPQCFSCVSQNRSCTYDVSPKKRGVQTGYIRTLEVALAWAFENVPDSEETLEALVSQDGSRGQNLFLGNDTKTRSRLHKRWRKSKVHKGIEWILSGADPSQNQSGGGTPDSDEDISDSDQDFESNSLIPRAGREADVRHGTRSRPGLGTRGPPTSLPSAQTVRGWKQADASVRLRHCLDPSSPHARYAASRGMDLQSVPSAYVLRILFLWAQALLDTSTSSVPGLILATIEQLNEQFGACGAPPFLSLCLSTLTRSHLSVGEHDRLDTVQNALSRIWRSDSQNFAIRPADMSRPVKLPPDHWRLLDIYFSYTHSWFPIVEKQEILKATYLYRGQGIALTCVDPTSAVHAELWSVMALASFQDTASGASPTSPEGYIHQPRSHSANTGPRAMAPQDIYDVARALIPSENGPFQVHHVRALLLLALVNIGKERFDTAAILTAFASRVALHLNLDHSHQQSQPQSSTISAFLGCCILDSMVCLGNNGSSVIKMGCLNSTRVSEDGLGEWEPWLPCIGFGNTATSQFPRNPAYSLSTFNQIYNIFEVVSQHTREDPGILRDVNRSVPHQSSPQIPSLEAARSTPTESPTAALNPVSQSFYGNNINPSSLEPAYAGGNPPFQMVSASYTPMYQQPSTILSPTEMRSATARDDLNVATARDLQLQQYFHGGGTVGNALDYDALLEDLSSIDCTDKVDADPQFMTNLGFAPGCNIAEIFTHDFGGI